ncbi:MAG: vWA domain-containing protein [Psychroflexus sp.]
MILRGIIFFSVMLISNFNYGQNFKKEKRIYMLDITKSMFGLEGEQYDIFDDVRNALYKGIKDIKNPETVVTVIPFQATHTYEVLDSWTFKSGNNFKFLEMKKKIDSYDTETVPSGYTDIYSALELAKKNIDRDRINYIFMLTDGEQSPVPSSSNKVNRIDYGEVELLNSLSNWCNYSKEEDVHLFYVMLTEVAANETIFEIIKKECNAYAVKGTNINIAFIKPKSNDIKINLNDNPEKLLIDLTANNWDYIDKGVSINLELENNTLFELRNKTTILKNNKVIIQLKRKNNNSFQDLRKNNPKHSKILLKLSTANDLEILNPTINITVRNKKERVLTLEFSDDE